MSRTKTPCPLLNATQAAFLCGPVSIALASHDGNGVPSLSRAFGCRVSPDRCDVVVFLPKRRAEPLLSDLARGSPVAAVFSRPQTHETLQLKATRVRLDELAPGDRDIMRRAGEAFSAELVSLGYSDAFSHAMMAPGADEAVAAVFTPAAVFEQTPGPQAGRRLQPPS